MPLFGKEFSNKQLIRFRCKSTKKIPELVQITDLLQKAEQNLFCQVGSFLYISDILFRSSADTPLAQIVSHKYY